MTKQYREQLEKAMKKREAEKTIYDQGYGGHENNLSWPMMEQQQMYMQQVFLHNMQQYGWNSMNFPMYSQPPPPRPFGYYEPFLDPLYENREVTRASPPGFSSDSSSQPSFQNSQLGPIGPPGPISKPPSRTSDPSVAPSDASDVFAPLFPSGGDAVVPTMPPSSSSEIGAPRNYSLFSNNDPIWQPLLESEETPKVTGWPVLTSQPKDQE